MIESNESMGRRAKNEWHQGRVSGQAVRPTEKNATSLLWFVFFCAKKFPPPT
jgi:hypothetical protein